VVTPSKRLAKTGESFLPYVVPIRGPPLHCPDSRLSSIRAGFGRPGDTRRDAPVQAETQEVTVLQALLRIDEA
jgi:hypothetical protein